MTNGEPESNPSSKNQPYIHYLSQKKIQKTEQNMYPFLQAQKSPKNQLNSVKYNYIENSNQFQQNPAKKGFYSSQKQTFVRKLHKNKNTFSRFVSG